MREADKGFPSRGAGLPIGLVLQVLAVIAFALVLALPGRSVLAQTFSFTTVRVEGSTRVDVPTVLSYAGIKSGQELTPGALNDATQRIVESGLFATVELVPEGSTLVIKVTENPMIDVINFEGNKRIKDEDLSAIIKSKQRTVYSAGLAQADAQAIAEAYRMRGRFAATVTPQIIPKGDNRVDLVFEITEGKVTEVERLTFNGNRAFSDRALRQVLETKQAGLLRQVIQRDTYIAERLELDKQLLTDFYNSRGYIDFQVLDASADVLRERDGVFVTFTIQEGQQYRIGSVDAVSEIEGVDIADFANVLKLRPGAVYSPALIDNNVTRLETLAVRKGLNFVRVDPRIVRDSSNQLLGVTFALVKGPRIFVERIDIEGNTTTLDEVVRRQFRTAEGDPFSPREIKQASERIRALGYFEDAQVESRPGSTPDQVIVNVDVIEKPTGSLSFGASYSTNSGVGVAIGFSEDNFLGRGQALSFDIEAGTDNTNVNFSFAEPAFLGKDLRFGLDAWWNTSDYYDAYYNTSDAGVRLSVGFPISTITRLNFNYSLSQSEITDVSEDSSVILQEEEAMGMLTSSAFGYALNLDTRREGLDPVTAYVMRWDLSYAGIGGDTNFVDSNFYGAVQTKLFQDDVTVRAIAQSGVFTALGDYTSRVTDRYFANGKIRGFERNGIGPRDLAAINQDALGGNYYGVVSLEADFPVGLPEEYGVGGGLFLDVGSVWGLDNNIGTDGVPVDDDMYLRVTTGVIVYWTTPLGPLKFTFSKALQKESYDKTQPFDFSIATSF